MTATRYVIYSRDKTPIDTKKSLRDNCDALMPIIQRILNRESLDLDKVELLYISVGRGLWIAFDYDNPEHGDCAVSGFRMKNKFTEINPYSVPASIVHQRIRNCPAFPVLVGGLPSAKSSEADSEKQTATSNSTTPSADKENDWSE
ncbi:Uncharacterized protein TPAR_03744 [Tolypocladium paradoxum]|uniref:Uncharacterized protein n=1 Tax=Tolypocladium paradoxum TaxID=94208 RepID=A0A2S4L0X1_9HYPO|nr:Uncharacterized protein TPAR_03744 [Tolypocladium paradoxum]